MRHHDLNRPLERPAPTGRSRRRPHRASADPVIDQWCEAVWRAALARMIHTRGLDEFAASEVAGDVVEQFLGRPSFWIEKYPFPETFVKAVSDSRLCDHLRHERRGRGMGATLARTPDGSTRVRRQVDPLVHRNSDTGEWEDLDPTDTGRDFTEAVAERIDLERAGTELTPAQVEALIEVSVNGRTTTEVGAARGVGHTPIVKHKQRATEVLRARLGDDYPSESS